MMKRQTKPDQLPSGKWRIRYTDENGKRATKIYEDEPTAIYHLRKMKIEIEEIRLGLRLPVAADKSFSEMCDYWLENRTTRKRNPKDDISIIRCHLRPYFGEYKVRKITVVEIDNFIATKSHLAEKTQSNILTLFISIMKLAKDQRIIKEAPKIRKPKTSKLSKDFRYLKTPDEINRFLTAAKDEGEIVHACYAINIFTGLRQGELAGLTWDKIDLKRRLIKIDKSFDGPTKNGETRFVPILDPIYKLLLHFKSQSLTKWVIPNQNGEMQRESGRIFQEVLHRVLERVGFQKVIVRGKEKRYITYHDLRHTFASHWMMNGGDIFRLKEILGHEDITTTMRYSHLSPHVYESDYSRFGTEVKFENADVLQLVSLK
jgi:integrase